MAKKLKTARAIEANAGIRAQFRRKLVRFGREFSSEVARDILLHLAETGKLAEDRSLTNPQYESDKKRLEKISAMVLAAWNKDPERFRDDVELFIQMELSGWMETATRRARKIAEWVARATAADVTASQRQAYVAAGLPLDFLKEKWKIPVVRQRISQTAAEKLPEVVEWSTNLITKMAAAEVSALQDAIVENLVSGKSVGNIQDLLEVTSKFDADRAKRVAIDQTNKITNVILRANDEELGITEGVWIHVPGAYTSRETHKQMDGKRFNLKEGMWDPDVKRNIQPAELPFCRCVYRGVINFSALIEQKKE